MAVTSADNSPGGRLREGGGGVVIPHSPRGYQRAGAWITWGLVQMISVTQRYRWNEAVGGPGPTLGEGEGTPGPALYCTWHNRLALCLPVYYAYSRRRNRRPQLAALVSASRDGAFLAAVLERFGVQPVRGSSSRRGPQAFLELVSWAERGYDLAITPDGPRGPCYVVQEGIMSLAQVTGLPVIPFTYNAHWNLRIKSWDRFLIPLPFSQCDLIVGRAIRVPRNASRAERKVLREELEKSLRELTRD